MKLKVTIIIFLLFSINKFGFSQKLRENSIGVVYLLSESEKSYEIEIVFPIQFLENNIKGQNLNCPLKFNPPDTILLFDETGIYAKVNTHLTGKIEFWCENDGGIQYRPTLHLTLDRKKFSKKLHSNKEIQNICCFAIANSKKEIKKSESPLPVNSKRDIRLKGKFGFDSWAAIWVEPDEAMNCDGEPDNNLMIFLYTQNEDYRLRCCGP